MYISISKVSQNSFFAVELQPLKQNRILSLYNRKIVITFFLRGGVEELPNYYGEQSLFSYWRWSLSDYCFPKEQSTSAFCCSKRCCRTEGWRYRRQKCEEMSNGTLQISTQGNEKIGGSNPILALNLAQLELSIKIPGQQHNLPPDQPGWRWP